MKRSIENLHNCYYTDITSISNDDTTLSIAGPDKNITIYSLEGTNSFRSIHDAHDSPVMSVKYSRDNNQLFSGD